MRTDENQYVLFEYKDEEEAFSATKRYSLKSKYNITEEQYKSMYINQNKCCKICNKKTTKLVVDHCHNTGLVRGLLCDSCNKLLGFARDNETILENAKTYIIGYKQATYCKPKGYEIVKKKNDIKYTYVASNTKLQKK